MWQAIDLVRQIQVLSMASMTLEVLEVEVLRLSAPDRTRLLERVVASLGEDRARDAAWDAVAERRDADIDAGLSKELPLDEVLARLKSELA
jgi:putative addiction module component (TIGR02574 family)